MLADQEDVLGFLVIVFVWSVQFYYECREEGMRELGGMIHTARCAQIEVELTKTHGFHHHRGHRGSKQEFVTPAGWLVFQVTLSALAGVGFWLAWRDLERFVLSSCLLLVISLISSKLWFKILHEFTGPESSFFVALLALLAFGTGFPSVVLIGVGAGSSVALHFAYILLLPYLLWNVWMAVKFFTVFVNGMSHEHGVHHSAVKAIAVGIFGGEYGEE